MLAVFSVTPCMAVELEKVPALTKVGTRQAEEIDVGIQRKKNLEENIRSHLTRQGKMNRNALISPPISLGSLPKSYDLRSLDRVTPVPNASGCASCWATAAMGSLESFLSPLKKYNFSEDHLQMFTGHCDWGAGEYFATAYFVSWNGPCLEADYSPSGTSQSTPQVQAHVQRVYFLPQKSGPLDTNWIKYAIKELGGVYMGVSWRGLTNPTYNSYYYPGNSEAHAVTLVGWDDNFDKSKFTYTTPSTGTLTPPGNGAFIAKNNFGPNFGDNGYYYISYYDGTIVENRGAVFTAEPSDNFNKIYQYDTYGMINPFFAKKGANVFTAEKDTDLTAVGFYANIDFYGADIKRKYLIEIYKAPNNGPIGTGGPAVSFKTEFPMGGFYTVRLPQKVSLKAGQKFSVVLSAPKPLNEDVFFGVEDYYSFVPNVTANPGESYFMDYKGNWQDLTVGYKEKSNLCIKAYTSPKEIYSSSVEFSHAENKNKWKTSNTSLEYELKNKKYQLDKEKLKYPFRNNLEILFTSPMKDQNINYLSLSSITVTFDDIITPGPYYHAITATSAHENKFLFNSINGKILTLTAISPFGSDELGGTVWTIRIPSGAVQNAWKNTLRRDYTFSFRVTGVN